MTNKRIIAAILAASIVLSSMSFSLITSADEAVGTEYSAADHLENTDFIYELNADGTVTINKYIGSDGNVVIPDAIDGLPVTVIGSYSGSDPDIPDSGAGGALGVKVGAFQDNIALKSVAIPDTVKVIEIEAFSGCENLESVTLGNSLEEVGSFAFFDCTNLKTVIIPKSVEKIGTKAFGFRWGEPDEQMPEDSNFRVNGFSIGCVPNTAAETYAANSCLDYFYTAAEKVGITSYSSTENAVRINWEKSDSAAGYRVYRFDEEKGEWVKVFTTHDNTVTTYRQSGLESGKSYKYKVRAFVKVEDKTVWGEYSDEFTAAAKPEAVVVAKTSRSKTSVRICWEKTACSGYKLQQYDPAKKEWKTVKLLSADKTEYKITGLKTGKTYKFRICAFKRATGKNALGKWTTVKVTL